MPYATNNIIYTFRPHFTLLENEEDGHIRTYDRRTLKLFHGENVSLRILWFPRGLEKEVSWWQCVAKRKHHWTMLINWLYKLGKISSHFWIRASFFCKVNLLDMIVSRVTSVLIFSKFIFESNHSFIYSFTQPTITSGYSVPGTILEKKKK